MKHLRLFEELKVGTYYTSTQEDSSTRNEEISGYSVKIIDRNSGEKGVFSISLILSSGNVMLQDLCFSELDEAKKHIADIITQFEKSDLKIGSFIIKKMILDLVVPPSSSDFTSMDKIVSPKEIYSILEKNLRPITLCYTNILPNKFKGIGKGKMNERTIEDELLNLQRELKYDDKVRAKEAIARWGRFINPMRLSSEGKNNFQMWIESSDGRKYGDIIKEFELMKIN
jgi:hypothetical protein